MKKIISALLFTSFAQASIYGLSQQEPLGCVDCFNFVAPSVHDVTTVNPAQVGQIAYDTSDGSFKGFTNTGAWLNLSTLKIAYLKDIKSSSVDGGDFTAGSWQRRDLNVVEGDVDIVSLSSNQFTLQPGKYDIEASAPAYFVNQHQVKLRNITDGSDDILGNVAYGQTANNVNATASVQYSTLIGQIDISEAKTYEIQHRGTTTRPTNGFGWAASFGGGEVYTQVKITKLK